MAQPEVPSVSDMVQDLLKGMSKQELASRLCVSTRMIYAYMKGTSIPGCIIIDMLISLWKQRCSKEELLKHATKLPPPAPEGKEIRLYGHDQASLRKYQPADSVSSDAAVSHPSYYTQSGIEFVPEVECIDIIRHLPYTLGAAIGYIWRAGLKGDKAAALQDIEKAKWHICDWNTYARANDALPEAARLVLRLRATDGLAALKLAAICRLLSGLSAVDEIRQLQEYLQNNLK